MNSSEQLKRILKPTVVVPYYLGQPFKISNLGLWYKSPFRNERTASFLVSDNKGIHDFGSSKHYDIISFLQEWLKIDFKTAINKLSYDFQITDCRGISKELEQYLIKRREEENQMRKKIDNWFNKIFSDLCDELHFLHKMIPHLNGEALVVVYKKELYLNLITELFINAREEEKVNLWKDKEKIKKCLK